MYRLSQKKLLYIEDDAESREMMQDILSYHGFKFIGAARGIEGIRLATAEVPDLILVDINLPDMNGYEVTTLLKSFKSLSHTPIIAITAETKDNARERTLTAGCDGFISKPINIADFIQRLNDYLQGHKESISPEVEKKYLTEYNLRLGEKLQNKIEELEKVNLNLIKINEELNVSKDQLTDYNNLLFTMNSLANMLRVQESPQNLLRILPSKLTEAFKVDRCLLFEFTEQGEKLNIIGTSNEDKNYLKDMKFHLDKTFYLHLKREIKILWVKNKSEILNSSLLELAQYLNSTSFIIGCFTGFGSRKDATGIFQSVATSTSRHNEKKRKLKEPKKLLIFLDRGRTQRPFATYEIRVLKAFLQTASIIYENMLLYHKMIKLLRIKEQEAITDPLTNVYNYRFFQSQIEREIIRAQRYTKAFSILMIDIDNFKQYNDENGHFNGDLALKIVANSLIKNIRKSDVLARYGGDEFVIVLPELGKDQAESLAKKLCVVIKDTKLPRKKSVSKINLTISLGVATFPEDGKSEENLIKKADDALYLAKKQGRNSVCIS